MRPPKTDYIFEIRIKKNVDKEKQNNKNYIHVINKPIPITYIQFYTNFINYIIRVFHVWWTQLISMTILPISYCLTATTVAV